VSTAYRRYADSAGKRRAWSAANRGNIAMREELLGLLLEAGARELAGQGRVLDIGCGNGFWLERLAEHGVAENRLSGVDVQPERVTRAARALPGATLVTADARHLPSPPEPSTSCSSSRSSPRSRRAPTPAPRFSRHAGSSRPAVSCSATSRACPTRSTGRP